MLVAMQVHGASCYTLRCSIGMTMPDYASGMVACQQHDDRIFNKQVTDGRKFLWRAKDLGFLYTKYCTGRKPHVQFGTM